VTPSTLLPLLALDPAAEELRRDPWGAWSLAPLQVAPLAIAGVLYAVRARRLGRRLPAWRRVAFFAGLAVFALALVSPVDPVGEEGLFAVHMIQHALLGGLAPLLVVLGLTGGMLAPVLRLPGVARLRALAHPAIALPLWAVTLVAWHLPPAFEAAISHDGVHALLHGTTFAAGALLWAPVVEPLPAPGWFGTGAKMLYTAGVWVIGLVFVNVLWFSGTVFYDRYAETAPAWGVSALEDQGNAGSVFMAEHVVIVLGVLGVLAFRLAREGGLQRRLIEAGVDPAAARRAVRYGRADELARRHGVATALRPGID
jgi:putative membrane protein